MKKHILLFIFLFLAAIGIEYELSPYTQGAITGSQYGHVGLCLALMLIYIIPAGLILTRLAKKWQTPLATMGLALIGGMFISGWLASHGNQFAQEFFQHLGLGKTFMDHWEPAISPPLVEEPAKLLAAGLALCLLPVKNLKSILLVGISSGLGFQISEDLSYIHSDLKEGFVFTISDTLYRITGSISSHWLYTGLALTGLAVYWLYQKKEPKKAKLGLFYFLAAFLLHFLWNSPFTAIHTPFPLTTPFAAALHLFVFYLFYQQVVKKEGV
ncbi:PrsW family glutamic-type intramembrane protease [Streptococcus oricebi]|uniref:PrsW family intramembrane metalloprotease n=1 Tax=Streptococcus oricebi TaxID=1547447 RepID=A0ABS5B560_9STRE|nr:PrsW family glutamic-type intramembrane protease [Streptococcus oricebi]MBP2623967.1 PrsW family intramembrane metalloprotease [Streptococcus oricebi]